MCWRQEELLPVKKTFLRPLVFTVFSSVLFKVSSKHLSSFEIDFTDLHGKHHRPFTVSMAPLFFLNWTVTISENIVNKSFVVFFFTDSSVGALMIWQSSRPLSACRNQCKFSKTLCKYIIIYLITRLAISSMIPVGLVIMISSGIMSLWSSSWTSTCFFSFLCFRVRDGPSEARLLSSLSSDSELEACRFRMFFDLAGALQGGSFFAEAEGCLALPLVALEGMSNVDGWLFVTWI